MNLFLFLKKCKYKILAIKFVLKGNRLGKEVMVSRKASLRKAIIGDYSYVAEYSELNCVNIGNYCSVGPMVHIGGMEHPYWKPSTSSRLFGEDCRSETRTIIGNDVWIGAQCCIKQGVVIGDGAIIGAHSFVNKNVSPYSVVFGSPAKFYKMRFDADIIDAINNTHFANYSPEKAKELLAPICEILEQGSSKQ